MIKKIISKISLIMFVAASTFSAEIPSEETAETSHLRGMDQALAVTLSGEATHRLVAIFELLGLTPNDRITPITSVEQMNRLANHFNKTIKNAESLPEEQDGEKKEAYKRALMQSSSLYSMPAEASDFEVTSFISSQAKMYIQALLGLSALKSSTIEQKEKCYRHAVDLVSIQEERSKKQVHSYKVTVELNPTNFILDLQNFRAICTLGYNANKQISELLIHEKKDEESGMGALLKAIHYGETHVGEYTDVLVTLLKCSEHSTSELESTINDQINATKERLINDYFEMFSRCRSQDDSRLSAEYYEKMVKIHKDFKGKPELRQKSRELLEAADKLKLPKRPGKTSRKLLQLSAANSSKRSIDALTEMMKNGEKSDSPGDLIALHYELVAAVNCEGSSFVVKNKKNPTNRFVQQINQIERKLSDLIQSEEETHHAEQSYDRLLPIYRKLRTILKPLVFDNNITHYLFGFLWTGNVDEAFIRTQVFDTIFKENGEEVGLDTHVLMAWTKSLGGDHDDWLKLIGAGELLSAEKEEARKRRQKEAHEDIVRTIQQTQKENPGFKAASPVLRKKKSAAATYDRFYYEPAGAGAGAGGSKLSRHKTAEEMREQKARDKALKQEEPYLRSASTTSASAGETEDEHHATFNLKEIYSLKGVAAKVEEAIISSKWNFTRKELIDYYKAMGCTWIAGRGSHEKIDFTKSLVISKNGRIVTIVSDSGGALTFGRWEGTVPHYLRNQILIARSVLGRSAEKASNIL